jgi:hypothetical protein
LNASTGGTIGGWTIGASSLTGGSTTLNSDGAITCANLTANTAGTIGGWTITSTGLQATGNGSSRITGNGLNIDASTNQATIGLSGTYSATLTGGTAAAGITLGTGGSATKLFDNGTLTLAGATLTYSGGKFNFGSGAATVTCGRIEIGSGGLDCAGGGSFSGAVGAASFNSTSSRKYKTNIKDLTNGLNMLNRLRPVTFDWKNNKTHNDIGMIAEEVNEIFPTIVYKNSDGEIEGLEYGKLVTVLAAALKELSTEVQELKRQIKELRK